MKDLPSLGNSLDQARCGTPRRGRSGFTLIELLVVVAVIAVLIAILLPALGKARDRAKSTVNLSNLRNQGMGVQLYLTENDNWFFPHEGWFNAPGQFSDETKDISGLNAFSDAAALVSAGLVADMATANMGRRAHWADYVYAYNSNPKAYLNPMLTTDEIRLFTLDLVSPGVYKKAKWGGYGYNVHFLGRAYKAGLGTFRARLGSDVTAAANTIVIADSAGSRKGAAPPGGLMANSYVVDPPLYSINRGARTGKYYQGVDAATSDADLAANPVGSVNWRYRAFPAPRNSSRAAGFVFADGHAENLTLKQVDDSNSDGVYDNGYWNGTNDVDPAAR